ncbi:hypothetical protein LCGC14_1050220 [marine sediment metagenome]|uniref:Uncharacterized protein n=1 Tax=marine sediment metagenome TaxID=412755 RepID=A0A0F9MTI7_9ZZZZ
MNIIRGLKKKNKTFKKLERLSKTEKDEIMKESKREKPPPLPQIV